VNVEPYLRADGTRIWSLMQLDASFDPRPTAGGEAGTSTVDECLSSTSSQASADQDDWHLQEPPWPTSTDKYTVGRHLWAEGPSTQERCASYHALPEYGVLV
jgi:hypothetical protein